MPSKNLSGIRRNLLRWYDKAHRDLPWRRTRDPYAIWIAETMLQQTQVPTVIPYYERFTRALPTVRALDRAPLRRVLILWSGLGYYRRAENLKKAARVVLQSHKGKIPATYNGLRSLPGVGDYTAGALMSIAFGKPYPALDGNTRRVLGRIFSIHDEQQLQETAKQLVLKFRPGDFNQGLMELGATICSPKKPRCSECPVASRCAARATRQPGKRTTASKNRTVRDVEWPLVIVRNNGKILLRRRPDSGILAGLWELPGGEQRNRENLRTTLKRHCKELDATSKLRRRVGEIRHSITYKRIRSPIFLLEACPDKPMRLQGSHWRWLMPSSLRRYPVSSMTLKAAKLLTAYEKSSF